MLPGEHAQRILRMVAAITRMGLVARPAELAVLRNTLYRDCGYALRQCESPVYDTASEREGDAVTWRPAACVDVCLLPNARGDEMLVALLLEPASRDPPRATLFSTCEPLPVPAPGVAYLAHMTVDRTHDGGQTVILIYDCIMVDAGEPGARIHEECSARYNRVQHALHCWQGRQLGTTVLSAQWVGHPSARAEIHSLRLPHAVDCTVALSPRGSYTRSRG